MNMQYSSYIPPIYRVRLWADSTLKHSCTMEEYMHILGIGHKDFERPHDIAGFGNKLDICVARGLASGLPRSTPLVKESLRIHRKQYHHRMWNRQEEGEEEDMLVGALDSICSLLENREYQGGKHCWDGVIAVANKNPEYKKKWMLKLIPELRKIKQPQVEIITLDNLVFDGLALPDEMKERIAARAIEAKEQFIYEGWL